MRGWRSALLCLVPSLAACALSGGIPREPFYDTRGPDSLLPYSARWTFIEAPQAATAKLVYIGGRATIVAGSNPTHAELAVVRHARR
ncbi:MAG: hypothetical protein ACE5JN_14905 [Candidatus Methylomirabilia bacterium]